MGGFTALGSGELAARVLAFFVAAILARRLGATGFGQLAFASALTSYLILVPSLAFQDLGMRAVARSPDAAPGITASVTRIRLALSGMAVAVVSLVAMLLPLSDTMRLVVILTAVAALPQALNVAWAYKALGKNVRVGVSLVVAQVVLLTGVLVFTRTESDVATVPLLVVVSEATAAVVMIGLLWRGWPAGSFGSGARVVQGAGTAVVNRLLRTLIVTADMVLLGLLSTSAQVGIYSAAYRVCFLLTAVAAAAHVVFQPALVRAAADEQAASVVLADSLWLSWSVGFPLVAGGIVVAPELLVSLFGEPFREGHAALRVLLVSTGMLFLHGTMQGAFLARNQLRLQASILAVAAAVNLALNGLLISRLGILGAAIATVSAEAVILIGGAMVLWRWRWRPDVSILGKPLLAGLGMIIVLLLVPRSLHVMGRIALGGVAYATFLAMVRGLPPQLIRELQRLTGRGRHRGVPAP